VHGTLLRTVLCWMLYGITGQPWEGDIVDEKGNPMGTDGDPVRVEGLAILAVDRVTLFVDDVTFPGLAISSSGSANRVSPSTSCTALFSAPFCAGCFTELLEVDGETLFAEPEEETTREELLRRRGDVDGENDEVAPNGPHGLPTWNRPHTISSLRKSTSASATPPWASEM
jgi:hypothetical protein